MDHIRMTKNEGMVMKTVLRSRFMVLFLTLLLGLSACGGKRLTKANVDEVTKGMSRKQVESILGPPTSVDSTDLVVTKKVTYTYKQRDELVTIVFFNDTVSSKESNLRD
jgi:outer membrane protein assembly factor BamE (lipoprotein component of BamABCDE complex)